MCSRNATNIGYRSIFPDKTSTSSQKKNEDHKTRRALQPFFFFFKERACIHPLRKELQGYKEMRTCPLRVPLQTVCRKSGAKWSNTQAMGLGVGSRHPSRGLSSCKAHPSASPGKMLLLPFETSIIVISASAINLSLCNLIHSLLPTHIPQQSSKRMMCFSIVGQSQPIK